jgi:hypothetical protein
MANVHLLDHWQITAAITVKTLCISAAFAMGLSLLATICYLELAWEGGSFTLGVFSGVIALTGFTTSIVLFGIAIRRRLVARDGV